MKKATTYAATMQPSKFPLLLVIAILLLFSSLSTIDGQHYFCDDQDGNFTSDETYGTTLDALLNSIITTTSSTLKYGLLNVSTSRPQYPDDIQMLGVCTGDLTSDTCRDCLNRAADQVRRLCPTKKQATMFEDNCWIRYSNSQLYGIVKTDPCMVIWNVQNASNGDLFMVELKKLLDSLRDEAASGGPIQKYATGNTSVDLYTLYSMVQCSPDLSDPQCSDCLVVMTKRLPQGKVGGLVLSPSCQTGFATFRYFNSIAVPLPSPPPPPLIPMMTIVPPPPMTQSGSDSSKTWIIVSTSSSFAVVVVICILVFWIVKRKTRPGDPLTTEAIDDDVGTVESLQYNLDIIKAATDNFSEDNKLGQGGFGSVFRGKLPSGQGIAVKRLSQNSGQGESEFKNEVKLLSRLQHRNLVRLLGYCLEGIERLLVYEFVPNSSLDKFIFDPLKSALLDWETRYKIITGIARGILYLHEDSRIRIIHRDLKASNILLDMDMHPKVSDFGMARLFEFDQSQADTSRIVGTYGYMAPEYLERGHFSVRSDVYSFGVLVLEIASGRQNHVPQTQEHSTILTSHAWRKWKELAISNIIDPSLNSGSSADVTRCIHIALLCVQEDVTSRPTMDSVVLMLNSHSITLPIPTQPAYFKDTRSCKGSNYSRPGNTRRSSGASIYETDDDMVNLVSRTAAYPQ